MIHVPTQAYKLNFTIMQKRKYKMAFVYVSNDAIKRDQVKAKINVWKYLL